MKERRCLEQESDRKR